MILKNSQISIQDSIVKNPDNSSRNYRTLDDLMSEQNISTEEEKTVHRRRDLDALG